MGKVEGRHERERRSEASFLRQAGLYVGIAFELPGTILGGLLVGYLLDNHFGTSPWLLIAMTLLAFAGAFLRLVHWVKYFSRERDGSRSKKNHTSD